MASKSMKDIQAAIDAAIDQDQGGGPNWDMGKNGINAEQDYRTKNSPDTGGLDPGMGDPEEGTVGRHDFGNVQEPPDVGPSMQGPIQAAMTHIQRGNATPEEMMMLRQVLNGPMPSANVDDDGEGFAARHAGTGRAGALMDAEDQMNGR